MMGHPESNSSEKPLQSGHQHIPVKRPASGNSSTDMKKLKVELGKSAQPAPSAFLDELHSMAMEDKKLSK
jgi:hypothetical protein